MFCLSFAYENCRFSSTCLHTQIPQRLCFEDAMEDELQMRAVRGEEEQADRDTENQRKEKGREGEGGRKYAILI